VKLIVLKERDAWVIRWSRLGRPRLYFESLSTWNARAAAATIFRDYDAAEAEMARIWRTSLLNAGEYLDVVPLAGAFTAA